MEINSILYILLVLMIILLVIVILIAIIYTKLIKFNRIIKEIEKVRDNNFATNTVRIYENRERIDKIIKVLLESLEINKDLVDKIRNVNEIAQRIYDFVHIDSIDKSNKLEEICQKIAENNKANNSFTMD